MKPNDMLLMIAGFVFVAALLITNDRQLAEAEKRVMELEGALQACMEKIREWEHGI